MRTLLWILGLFAFAVGVAVTARYNEGYALFVMPPWRVQISFNFLIILILVFFALLYGLGRLIARTMALPSSVKAYRLRTQKEKAVQAFRDAVRLFFEGRYGQAYRHATAAYEANESPGLAALLSARAAHMMREYERCNTWLENAAKYDRELRIARLMIEAEHAVADRNFDNAVRALEALRSTGQRHIAALRLFLQAEQGRQRWEEVARIARQLSKHNGLTSEQAAPIIRRAWVERMREREGDLMALQRLWEEMPNAERHDSRLLVRALPLFLAAGDAHLMPAAIEAALKQEWDSELVLFYGLYKEGDIRGRLANAEAWLKRHRDDANLLLTLGRLCTYAKLWGKAQSYLETSLSIAASRDAHLELARLYELLDRSDQAQPHYRAAAELCSKH